MTSGLSLANNMVHHHSVALSNGLSMMNNNSLNANNNNNLNNTNNNHMDMKKGPLSSNNSSSNSMPPSSPNHIPNVLTPGNILLFILFAGAQCLMLKFSFRFVSAKP